MSKIGILTYHSGFNYGACLQAYALRSTLIRLGYNAEIINFETERFVASREMFSRHPRRIKEVIKYWTRLPYWNSLHRREKLFNSYTFDVLHATQRYKTEQEVINNIGSYDCIVCGSDQIWNLSEVDAPAANLLFYLNFPKSQRRVSYAASFGKWVGDADSRVGDFLPWLQQFDAISVREMSGVNYLRSKGLACALTLDPTVLLDREDYDPICAPRLIDTKYVLMFGWNTNKDLIDVAKKVAKELKLPVFNIVPPPRALCCGIPRKLDVGPCEFLSMIKHAEFVVTNSFHGTAFSMTFERPFVSVVTGHADTRMESLLQQLGLADHLLTKDNVDVEKMMSTNYSEVRAMKDVLRKDSLAFLRDALQGL